MKSYFEELVVAKDCVIQVLKAKGIDEQALRFGGEGVEPKKLPTVPTAARSEFLANRAMGDWAEQLLSVALRQEYPSWTVSQYGNTESIAAGDDGFADVYRAGLQEVRRFGKRPDLLLCPAEQHAPADLSLQAREASDVYVAKAVAAIEVRSSKFNALTYMAVRAADHANGVRGARMTPSFTVKVEDLMIVYRWIERYRIPQSYWQVFFDCVWGINVLKIFQIIGSGAGFKIETPEKSQQKSTIMIPITSGIQIARFTSSPAFLAESRSTRLGRIDAYVKPTGGTIELDTTAVKKVLSGS